MSKLENAFSKAIREGMSGKEGAKNGADGEPNRAVVGTHTERTLQDIVSAKAQIGNMAQKTVFTGEQLSNKRLIHAGMKDKNLLNTYRNLRTKLLEGSRGEGFSTLVTSVASGSGSSLIAANIAATFALDAGKTALLIEGNVHTPSLASLFELESGSRGLTEFLEAENMTVADILYETGVPRFRFIPSGEPTENSTEYFTSERMRGVMREIAMRYPERYPIIDAPSIEESADTRILLDLCDKAILVVPYGRCSEDDILNAALSIGKEKLAGVVLNQF